MCTWLGVQNGLRDALFRQAIVPGEDPAVAEFGSFVMAMVRAMKKELREQEEVVSSFGSSAGLL